MEQILSLLNNLHVYQSEILQILLRCIWSYFSILNDLCFLVQVHCFYSKVQNTWSLGLAVHVIHGYVVICVGCLRDKPRLFPRARNIQCCLDWGKLKEVFALLSVFIWSREKVYVEICTGWDCIMYSNCTCRGSKCIIPWDRREHHSSEPKLS